MSEHLPADARPPLLPPPNPLDWLTVGAVAECLRISRRTVDRLTDEGKLRPYRPAGARGEKTPRLYWGPQIVAYAEAITRTKRQDR